MTSTLVYFMLAIAAAFLALYMKQIRPDFALCITLAGAIIMMTGVVPRLNLLINDIYSFSHSEGIDNSYVVLILKIIGITYLAEFASDICTDAGEKTLAMHAETIGKITVAFIALPIVEDVFAIIFNLLE